jgi:hypothetical protein
MVERAPHGMRGFRMCRDSDASGVSGTGLVLEGVQFSTGVVVIHWLTPPPRGSISVFDSLEQFLSIHVRPHPDNGTVIDFDDGERVVCLPAEVPPAAPAAALGRRVLERPVSGRSPRRG